MVSILREKYDSAVSRLMSQTGDHHWWKKIKKARYLYLLFLPTFLYLILFKFAPMFGLVIAFKNYNVYKGMWVSPWVGFKHFEEFFNSIYFWRLLRNTLAINLYDLIFGFPAPILLALLLNEVYVRPFKRIIQTVSYLPHFISAVIIASMAVNFLSPSTGLINNLIASLGFEKVFFLGDPRYFWPIYTLLNIWKESGWGTILYLAALTSINSELYESARIDGAGRFKQALHITLPGISGTMIILFILKLGKMLDVNFETIILLYSPNIYETADVLSTYIYRRGLIDADYSFSAAVGLFQSAIGFLMITAANKFTRKYSETSLW